MKTSGFSRLEGLCTGYSVMTRSKEDCSSNEENGKLAYTEAYWRGKRPKLLGRLRRPLEIIHCERNGNYMRSWNMSHRETGSRSQSLSLCKSQKCKHTAPCTDEVLLRCTLGPCTLLLASVTPVKAIYKGSVQIWAGCPSHFKQPPNQVSLLNTTLRAGERFLQKLQVQRETCPWPEEAQTWRAWLRPSRKGPREGCLGKGLCELHLVETPPSLPQFFLNF